MKDEGRRGRVRDEAKRQRKTVIYYDEGYLCWGLSMRKIIYEEYYLLRGISIKNPTSLFSPYILHTSPIILSIHPRNALRLRNWPSPGLPTYLPSSMTTRPRERTVFATPRTFIPSYAE